MVVDTGQRFRWNMFAAITPDGQLHFRIQSENSKAASFIEFLQTLQAEQGKPYSTTGIHRARAVKEFSAASTSRVVLPAVYFLQLLWAWVKR